MDSYSWNPAWRAADSISLLAWEPDLILEGSASDWHTLERELAARQKPGADLGFPDGAAIGWVGFDGRFRFGFYAKLALFLHGTSSWQSPLELPGIAALPSFSRIPFRARLGKRQFEEMVRPRRNTSLRATSTRFVCRTPSMRHSCGCLVILRSASALLARALRRIS